MSYIRETLIIAKQHKVSSFIDITITGRTVAWNQTFSYLESAKNRVGAKSNKAFLHLFCQSFGIFDNFSKFCSIFSALHVEKSSNMAKNEEKPCSTCLSTYFSTVFCWNPKPGFWVPIPPLLNSTFFKIMKIITIYIFYKYLLRLKILWGKSWASWCTTMGKENL